MGQRVKIQQAPDEWVEGEQMEFDIKDEPWAAYSLEDGYTIRMKLVVSSVVKTDKKDQDGNPVYIVRSTNVLTIVPPGTYSEKEVH